MEHRIGDQTEAPLNAGLKTRRIFAGTLGVVAVFLLAGCTTIKETEPPRTATEQLLLSTAAERAAEEVDLGWLKGKKIYLEEKYFASYDKGYAVGVIRQSLSAAGALLQKTNDQADFIVEIRSGGLGINSSETLFGIPATSAPVPLAGTVATPEVAFYKSDKQDTKAKFELFAYNRVSAEFLGSSEAMEGTSYFHFYKIIGYSWRRTDVQELKKKPGQPPPGDHPKTQ